MSQSRHTLADLEHLMQRLRRPETGCPWDLKQSYLTITSSTIEEAYEVVDAIEQEDYQHLQEELGDLLFQVIFYAQLASEESRFTLADVVHGITAKLLRRHPHVFPDGTLASERSPGDLLEEAHIKASWEQIKTEERHQKGSKGLLDDVPRALPAMTRATKLQKRAAKIGFDWPDVLPVVDKLDEEVGEFRQALAEQDSAAIDDELGDIFFTCANIARHLGRDPEAILRRANAKFERRFRRMEARLPESTEGLDEETLERLWLWSKQQES